MRVLEVVRVHVVCELGARHAGLVVRVTSVEEGLGGTTWCGRPFGGGALELHVGHCGAMAVIGRY